jgi:hypothetical protein
LAGYFAFSVKLTAVPNFRLARDSLLIALLLKRRAWGDEAVFVATIVITGGVR